MDRTKAQEEAKAVMAQRQIEVAAHPHNVDQPLSAASPTSTRGGLPLPVVVRRSRSEDTARDCLHMSIALNGVPHQVEVTHTSFKVYFRCVDALGLSKSLTSDVDACAALLMPNEVQDLFAYVLAREPDLDVHSHTAMIMVWTCELALRRYASFLALADDHPRLREIHEFAMRMGSKLKYDAQKRKMDAEAIRRHAGQTGWPAAARALRAQPDR